MNLWESNLEQLQARFPGLADRLTGSGCRRSVSSFKAQDGFPAYGLRQGAQWQPLTNPVDPGTALNRQMADLQPLLADFSRPLLIVGLYPGAELLHLFNLREKAAGNHCAQPVWVCIDSLLTLCGFLQTYDARALLASDRVRFFWHEELPAQVEWLRAHPEFPHVFTCFSLAPDATLERILAPLAGLIQERDAAAERYCAANTLYYRALSDARLADILAGRAGRRPRLLVPSCSWSTVIQYSVRDTCRAFERAGWETQIVDGPAMLTPYHLIQTIHRFKPDLFLYVDHLRQEIAGLVPAELLVVSWVQDAMPAINNRDAAARWNEHSAGRNRDLIVGYTDHLKIYGYREERLTPVKMMVDAALFRPRELTPEQSATYSCDVCFASNCGLPTDRLVREKLTGLFAPHGLSEPQLMDFHDRLWAHYRAGGTLTDYQQLVEFLGLNWSPHCQPVQLLFWRLNDIIYRHVVLEWLDEYARAHPGFRLHLYGQEWEQHPRFAPYARGRLAHGAELSAAYQAARCSLHLNAAECDHQRIAEILLSRGRPLVRNLPGPARFWADHPCAARAVARTVLAGAEQGAARPLLPDELETLNDWACRQVVSGRLSGVPAEELAERLQEGLDQDLFVMPAWMFEEPAQIAFGDPQRLAALLDALPAGLPRVQEGIEPMVDGEVCRQLLAGVGRMLDPAFSARRSGAAGFPEETLQAVRTALLLRDSCSAAPCRLMLQELKHPGNPLVLAVAHASAAQGALEESREVLARIQSERLSPEDRIRCLVLTDLANGCKTPFFQEQVAAASGTCCAAATVQAGQIYSQGDVFRQDRAVRFFEAARAAGRLSGEGLVEYALALAAGRRDEELALGLIRQAYAEAAPLRGAFSRYALERYWNFDCAPERALELFALDRQLERPDPAWLSHEARLYARSGQLDRADELIQPCRSGLLSAQLALDYFQFTGRPAALEQLFARLEADPQPCARPEQGQLVKAAALALSGNWSAACAWVETLYAENPAILNGWTHLGLCSLFMNGDLRGAWALMHNDLELNRSRYGMGLLARAVGQACGALPARPVSPAGRNQIEALLSRWRIFPGALLPGSLSSPETEAGGGA